MVKFDRLYVSSFLSDGSHNIMSFDNKVMVFRVHKILSVWKAPFCKFGYISTDRLTHNSPYIVTVAGLEEVLPAELLAIHRYTPSWSRWMLIVIVSIPDNVPVAGLQVFVVLSNFSQENVMVIFCTLLVASHDSEVLPVSLIITELGCCVMVGGTGTNY